MVIREEISSQKSTVFTPTCTVSEGSDGTLIINNDFQKAKSRVVANVKLEDWTYEIVTKGNDLETKSIVFENDESKLQSFVMINDPTLNFYNKTTKLGLKIDRQYILSSEQPAPKKEKMIEEYKNYIDLSSTLIKIQQTLELGKQVVIQEQVELYFTKNQTKGQEAKQGIYNKVVTRPHLEDILEVNALKVQ